jgi:hypothetical protein
MVGFIEPVGTVTQSAQADRNMSMRKKKRSRPRFSRQRRGIDHLLAAVLVMRPPRLGFMTGRR